MSALPPGSRIGRFEISGLLGEGAMGIVYLAHDPQIERPVAVKTLRTAGSGAPPGELETRFLKEAKLAGRLQHPNIVTIYEAGQDGTIPYIAMEYVDGEPLTRFRDKLTVGQRVEVIREAALALQHAHERGVLHRDVKPGNILLTRDRRVKVADFGIGKLLSGTAELTRTGQMIGSPAYMSPEQVRGAKLDGRSDYFSLGVVFYELLTGVRPFPGDSITTLVYQILHTEPRDPLEVRADLPSAAKEVFTRLLAKNPEQRPKDGAAFLAEIRRIADQLGEGEPTVALTAHAPGAASTAPVAPSPASTRRDGAAAVIVPPIPPAPLPPAAAGTAPSGMATATSPGGGRPVALLLFGIAAILIALAFFVSRWRKPSAEGPAAAQATLAAPAANASAAGYSRVGKAPTATASAAVVSGAGGESPEALPGATVGPLPTAGPSGAADAVVGSPRTGGATGPRASRPTPAVTRIAASSVPPPAEIASESRPSRESAPPADNLYRTRRYAKFGVSPDQARMYVDGRYVGIANDWDDRGGGKKFEFSREGAHRVRFELPGHRDLNVEVIVSPGASDDTADVGDELKRESRVPYTKLGSPSEQTVGPVVFEVDPPDATIIEGSRTLGSASSFGPSSPLRLSGPMVHDLVISAPGRKSKSVRILVGPSAEKSNAKVKVELKKE